MKDSGFIRRLVRSERLPVITAILGILGSLWFLVDLLKDLFQDAYERIDIKNGMLFSVLWRDDRIAALLMTVTVLGTVCSLFFLAGVCFGRKATPLLCATMVLYILQLPLYLVFNQCGKTIVENSQYRYLALLPTLFCLSGMLTLLMLIFRKRRIFQIVAKLLIAVQIPAYTVFAVTMILKNKKAGHFGSDWLSIVLHIVFYAMYVILPWVTVLLYEKLPSASSVAEATVADKPQPWFSELTWNRKAAILPAILGVVGAVGYLLVFYMYVSAHLVDYFHQVGPADYAVDYNDSTFLRSMLRENMALLLYMVFLAVEVIVTIFGLFKLCFGRKSETMRTADCILLGVHFLFVLYFIFQMIIQPSFSEVANGRYGAISDQENGEITQLVAVISVLPLFSLLIPILDALRQRTENRRAVLALKIGMLIQLPIIAFAVYRLFTDPGGYQWEKIFLLFFNAEHAVWMIGILTVLYVTMPWLARLLSDWTETDA